MATDADIPAMSEIRLSVQENTLSNPGKITRQMYEAHLDRLGRGEHARRQFLPGAGVGAGEIKDDLEVGYTLRPPARRPR